MRDVIIACDFKNKEDLYEFLKPFDGLNPYLKVGMEIFYKEGPQLVKDLHAKGFKIFLDLKCHDIPNTVESAMRNLGELGVEITNVHAAGGIKMMEAARRGLDATESGKKTKLIAVTQLTSISQETLENELLIKENLADVVKQYALNAKAAGLDGVVCSALEAPIIKELGLLSVTPGIRFADNSVDDQKRVATPALAKELGSTYIVVGRSITKAEDPVAAYKRCVKEFC
ncbi:MAG: orotidine-5'-phosphate decarboxylase [Acholeplasmatales bacterium]|jgi:orotidine-5'-phosphate decarboxylase|nr:orotidine-5'-phosphate decarboxylase [Acholeplasmatales bacterium]MBR6288852.1 orotidine-5'-phosphate decarboxylase [Acholeplasmatales bacterium]